MNNPTSNMASTNAMLRAHGVRTDRITAWTICYFPFTMGGSVWHAGGAEIPCDEPVWHCGHAIALCRGPDGMTCVVEFTTGAIVGETMEEVMRDLSEGDPEVMAKQVEQARAQRGSLTIIPAEDLWNRLRKAREKVA